MKVLFSNRLKESAITGLYQNDNYPVENLYHMFLYKKYKSTTYVDTITITFDDNETIDAIFYGYSNVSAMEVKLYNSVNTLLATKTIDCTYSSGSLFFTAIPLVRKAIVAVSCPVTEDLYIGGMAFGQAVTFPDPIASFAKNPLDNSEKEISTAGQVSYIYTKPLVRYSLSFTGLERDDYNASIFNNFLLVGKGNIWVDITEDNHIAYQPLYCTSEMVESPERNNDISFKVNLLEAR